MQRLRPRRSPAPAGISWLAPASHPVLPFLPEQRKKRTLTGVATAPCKKAGTIFGRTSMMRLVASLIACLAIIVGLTPNAVSAYPTRPVTLILGFAPGGPSDVMARIFSKRLEQALGQPIVIENRSGA